ncbi:MAG: group I truncated hemoglobin [Gemmatimonadaceae bacterium]
MHTRHALVLFTAVAFAAACEKKPAAQAEPAPAVTAPATLHERLGGTAAIASVVDAFVANVAADKRINKYFARVAGDTAAMRQFKQKMVDQICEGTGGPCKYTGLDMKAAHMGMGVTNEAFDALVEDLVKALDGLGVPAKEKGELLAILGPMRADMVK